jgi:hypothetical protein
MSNRQHPPITAPRIRRDGWTNGKRVTFFVTLAATGSVTLAAASVGMSRKSAYALKKRDRTFSSLWDRGLAMAGKARRNARPPHAEGDKSDAPANRATPSNGVKLADPDRALAEADRDRFFAALQMRHSGASLHPRIAQASCQRRETVRR